MPTKKPTKQSKPRLPKRCECGGKMVYAFAFDRVWSDCETCSPVTIIDPDVLKPKRKAVRK